MATTTTTSTTINTSTTTSTNTTTTTATTTSTTITTDHSILDCYCHLIYPAAYSAIIILHSARSDFLSVSHYRHILHCKSFTTYGGPVLLHTFVLTITDIYTCSVIYTRTHAHISKCAYIYIYIYIYTIIHCDNPFHC